MSTSSAYSNDSEGPRFVIVGAGISGICLAIQLLKAGIRSVTILEKSEDMGGVWLDNTYPGCICDVPSILYSFSFYPKYDWSRKYAPQSEILDYFKECADHFGVRDLIQFRTEVTRAVWDDDSATWNVETDTGESFTCDFFVSAVGQLSLVKMPNIEGSDSFEGPAFHSARWNRDFDFRDRRVAVVGSAGSAIQIVPKLAELARKVTLFQRSPNWILRRHDHRYPDWMKAFYRYVPFAGRIQRWAMYLLNETRILFYNRRTQRNKILTFWARLRMRQAPKHLHEQVIPTFPAAAKRVLISNDYLQSLYRENVSVVTESIERITPNGIITSLGEEPVDAIVYATGFESTKLLAPMEILGRDGISLNDSWGRRPHTYFGMLSPDFPNFFMLYGPNTNLGHNSIIFMVECQVRYILRCLSLLRQQNKEVIEVTREATEQYDKDLQEHLREKVWNGYATNWYKTDQGDITNNWGRSTLAYWRQTRVPDEKALRLSSRRAPATAERAPVAH